MCHAHLLLVAYTLLGAALSIHRGALSKPSFALAAGALIATGVAVLLHAPRKRQHPLTVNDVLMVLLALVLLGLFERPITYPGTEGFSPVVHGLLAAIGVLIGYFYLPHAHTRAVLRRGLVLGAAATLVGLRLWIPVTVPNPIIDVFTVQQESAEHLLHGKNPYSTPTSDPYEGTGIVLPYKAGTQLGYPPTSVLAATVGYILFGDVRVLYALCDAAFAWMLWRLSRRAGVAAELLPLAWLLHPQGLLTIGQSWTEPLILAGFGATALAYRSGNRWLTAAAHGLTVSMKQYLVIVVPLVWLLERRLRELAVAVVAMAATAVPFLLWDAGALWNGMCAVLGQWRVDSLSLGSWLLWVYGVQLGAWYSANIGIVAAAATALLLRNAERLHAYVASSCMGLFVLFLLGKQGFLNYYMLVSGLLLLLLATALDQPTQRRMSKDV